MNGRIRLGLSNAGAAVAIIAILALVLGLWWATAVGPLRSCEPIAPHELPSGAAPGQGVEGVTAGAKQLVWGSGADRVEQVVGLTFYFTPGWDDDPTLVGTLDVRGQPATVYRFGPNPSNDWDIGFSWDEDGCGRTVFLSPGTTPEQALDYAARY
jgi:hypothetical protein